MCIFRPAFWPSSAQSPVLSACEAQSLLVLGFPEERLPCSRSSLDVARKWADKPDSNFREGSSAGLGVCSRPGRGFSLRWKIFQKAAIEIVDSSVDFCGGFLVAKHKRKIRRKNPPENPPADNKNSAGARPPRNPPARPKNLPQNLSTNPPVKPPSTRRVFFDRRFALGGVFRAWILGHSLAAFWAWSRLPR